MSHEVTSALPYEKYLTGGGEMGELTRNFDWAATPIGSPDTWPPSLLISLNTILNSRFPMFIWWGPELIQFYNDAYRPSLGNEGKHPAALGQRGEECWPEIWNFIKPLIDQVMNNGEGAWFEDQLLPIYRNNRLEDVYWTFGYSRLMDEEGNSAGVLVTCHETTEKVLALSALTAANKEVEYARIETERQYSRLRRFYMQSPSGICILDGPDLVFELVNPLYQELFPGRTLLGKKLLEGLPEIEGQPIYNIITDVYKLDKSFEGTELLVPLAREEGSPVEERYFNFIYQPRHDFSGKVDGVMVFVFEVTEMVNARKELEKAQESVKLSVRAAELGTFDMDLIEGKMFWDDRCRHLFGITHQDIVTYEKDFITSLHPDDRIRITKIIDDLFDRQKSSGDYDVEYRTVGAVDGRIRWVRAKGKVYFNDQDIAVRFIGSALDITEQKTDELRKNDFIGMVSHELKTPLTSLNAYLQVLISKTKESEDPFVSSALTKAYNQAKKMNAMINGFLNISGLESGKIKLNLQSFDLSELIDDVIKETLFLTCSHEIIKRSDCTLIVFADREKISVVISNLLNNAVKYSPRGHTIELECKQQENMSVVSVKDEGMGVKPEDINKLFDRYYRVDSHHTQNISGFGIGLYLCSEIIQRHDGRIWAESEKGVGSTFYFSLPSDKAT